MKRCKNCKEPFTPRYTTLEKYCFSIDCRTVEALLNLDKLKKKNSLESKIRLKEKAEALKTTSDLKNDLQKLVNKYVRLRDYGLNCISCGVSTVGKKVNASHYLAVGNYPAVRYNLYNINVSCIECNLYKGGNLVEYRVGLINKIGIDKVECLEAIRNTVLKLTKAEIIDLIAEYQKKIKNFYS